MAAPRGATRLGEPPVRPPRAAARPVKAKPVPDVMRIAVLDCWAGVAGDMWVGALLDAGVPMAPLAAAVKSLALPGVAIRAAKVMRAGLAGTHFVVDRPGNGLRSGLGSGGE